MTLARFYIALATSLTFTVPAFAQDKPADAKPADAKPAEAANPADAKPADAPAGDAPKADAPAMGSLSVSSNPSGKVFLDGADTGLTTPVVDLPVAPGKHTLKIVSPDGREQSSDFEIVAGDTLNLNINLPEATPAKAEEPKKEEPATSPEVPVTPEPPAADGATAPWTWMTVAGWSGLGLGTISLLSGAVVLTTPTDPDQPFGFGLFGAGVGLVIGGSVLLYLDTELADQSAAPSAAPASAPAR